MAVTSVDVHTRHEIMPLLALRGLVVFPGTTTHFDVARKKSMIALEQALAIDHRIFLVMQRDSSVEDPTFEDLHTIGVVAHINQLLRLPGEAVRVVVDGLYRADVADVLSDDPVLVVDVRRRPERRMRDEIKEEAYTRECLAHFHAYLRFSPQINEEILAEIPPAMKSAGRLADRIAAAVPLPAPEKQRLLEITSVEKRILELTNLLAHEVDVLSIEQEVHNRVQDQMDQNQREYYLREQLKAIYAELGEEDDARDTADRYRARIEQLDVSDEVREALFSEAKRLAKMPAGSHEAPVISDYLDTCLALPWNTLSKDNLDLRHARRVLDRDHHGMERVKDRIIENLAVRRLSSEMRGQVICLVGPPGVGKTSVVKGIAEAMGRKYVRVALGGVHDESEIRGHRKTYIGAMPGRIIAGIKQAGTRNPVMLLDEVDKLSSDFRGDPSSALLEVLDGEQNNTYQDHYVGLPFDLSEVLFITTANDASAIPPALYDRMDVIEMSSYTAEEKFHIAKEHLVRRQLVRHGLTATQLRIPDEAIRTIISGYTREAGVRTLDRHIAKICRVAAKRVVDGETKRITVRKVEDFLGPVKFKPETVISVPEIGVVNGLAWTSVGGELLQVEVAVLEGSGKLELTGSLGDVMKESARAAVSYVRARAAEWGIDTDFYKNKDIHIHVPEGATPKDGPSAGVTITTALVSALTGIAVRQDVAMTGEVTLRGRVLPIGGLREKSMAAFTHAIRTVIIPAENTADIAECDTAVHEAVTFVPVAHMDAVLKTALVHMPEPTIHRAVLPRSEGQGVPAVQ